MSMKIRTKEEIDKAMKKQGIINKDGNFTGKLPAATTAPNARTVDLKKIKQDRKEQKAKARKLAKVEKSDKVVLEVEKIEDFAVKEKMFDDALKSVYGDRYDSNKGTVKFDNPKGKPVFVNVLVDKMKIRSKATSNTSGLHAWVVKNENKWTLGEYAGKFSITALVKRIDKFGESELSK